MKKFNRKTTIALAAAIMLTMTACGNNDGNDNENNTSSGGVAAYQSSQADITSSYAESTTTTEAETEPAETEITTTETETAEPQTVSDDAYDGIEAYVPKDDTDKAIINTFEVGVKAIKDEDIKAVLLNTDAREEENAIGFSSWPDLDKWVEVYERNDYERWETIKSHGFNLKDMGIAEDGSYVITNIEKIPSLPAEYANVDGEELETQSLELYQEYGFTVEQMWLGIKSVGSDESYFVTFISNIDGENKENTLVVYRQNPESDSQVLKREWILDCNAYRVNLNSLKGAEWTQEYNKEHGLDE